jgi:putative ABC transport system permease protein
MFQETYLSEIIQHSPTPVPENLSSFRFRMRGLWRWIEAFNVAVGSILANRLRSSLTIIGIVIGVAVVALVAALLEGAQAYVGRQAAELGPGTVRIDKASFQDFIGDGQAFVEALARRNDLTIDDLKGLRQRLGTSFDVGAQVDASLPVQRGNRTLKGIAVQGITPNVVALSALKIDRGRELTETDDEFRRYVCVIGADVADYLFPTENPIGRIIKVGTSSYEVVGTVAPRGSSFGASQDGFVQLPLFTFAKVFGGRSRSIALLAKAKADALTGAEMPRDQIEETVRFAMRQQRRLSLSAREDFSITTAKSIEAFAGRLTSIVGFVLYPLTGIALAVGGIIVMNMMLASVTERTREIGIRKSLGARRRDILAQFLIESTLLTFVGGLCGAILAAIIVQAGAELTGLPLRLPLWALATSVIVSSVVGIVFGVFPSRRAARLDPIEALRTE